MAVDTGLFDWIAESVEPLGTLTRRAMMGGATLYLDGQVFAIIASEGGLWFESDAISDAQWDAPAAPGQPCGVSTPVASTDALAATLSSL